ncbi:cob(I)yrinic acid a,c-diamide adenosyltransferase [bacterium]|nr:cob(I)yrinic acid a,c-diamide adenosyltransferase [bacterium]
MKIYTKGGDQGQTGLFGGQRVPKDHLRLHTYGTFDELNAFLGLVLSEPLLAQDSVVRSALMRVQSELFQLGAELATPPGKPVTTRLIEQRDIELLESEIDAMEGKLAPLKSFILPGGSKPSAHLHLSRTVCRRAERELVVLNRSEPVRPEVLGYVNRLSDYLFVAARYVNLELGVPDVPWNSPKP